MHLTEETARQIISLNPYKQNIIDPSIAERQFQVILKGFNYLVQPENNFLYIGDEVGLGKTYIALGIASLLRLYSEKSSEYVDSIFVPKINLQYKWQKEIRTFTRNNYLRWDNIVKNILGDPVGVLDKDALKHSLDPFYGGKPQYAIYRNTSFSIASDNTTEPNRNNQPWIDNLRQKLPAYQQDLFSRIIRKFKNESIVIKRAFAYLLNQQMPEIDLLIVDEAHNFKHGIGQRVSIRNQVVSRVLGVPQETDELTEAFPELLSNFRPRVRKLLCLSATPINNSLHEIKNQFDCFLANHYFKNLDGNESDELEISNMLNRFMIRGVMNFEIDGKSYSRNGYRHEHRKGNVEMKPDADFQKLNDNSTALVMSLVQYKTIKELKWKNNNVFEMGMLAGFESFYNTSSAYEDETLENRKEKEAKDEHILKHILDSYQDTFKELPPHPKQESLVNELFQQMIHGEKSLIYVRRIASVRELERKLFKKYSDYLISKIQRIYKSNKIPEIKTLLENYQKDDVRQKADQVLEKLGDRIAKDLESEFYEKITPQNPEAEVHQSINKDLKQIYYSLKDQNPDVKSFKSRIEEHTSLVNIKTPLKNQAIILLKNLWNNDLVLDDDEDDENDESSFTENQDEERAPYFFQRFFYNEGRKFKKRSYQKDWYELNLLLLNDKHGLFNLDLELLTDSDNRLESLKELKRFQTITEQITRAIKSNKNSNVAIPEIFRSNTFMTELLLNLCDDEFSGWIEEYKNLIRNNYYASLLEELTVLTELLKSIFRQGSGLLPAFIAEAIASNKNDPHQAFIDEMRNLLTGDFNFVLNEISQIILDYQKIVERNFDDVNKIRYNLIQQLPVAGVSGRHKKDLKKTAIQFRMPGYPYVLITTDILKEGEDLHAYCKNIYHYGIAWNPSDMEQRTGRIDRVDSYSYRKVKETEGKGYSEIPFETKLQVFYPYLADTLEANQMRKLFYGMDKFIDIFYKDLSAGIEKDAKANVDERVLDIPEQRKGFLKSKYDHDSFCPGTNGNPLPLKESIGIQFSTLQHKMQNLFSKIQGHFDFFVEPEFDDQKLVISGTMKINNGRHGPFNLYLQQTSSPGNFAFQMESTLGRVQHFGKKSSKNRLFELLDNAKVQQNLDLYLKEYNSFLNICLAVGDDATIPAIISKLYSVVKFTDDIENQITQNDEDFNSDT